MRPGERYASPEHCPESNWRWGNSTKFWCSLFQASMFTQSALRHAYLQTWNHWGTATTLVTNALPVQIKSVRRGNPLIYMSLASIFHLASNPMHFLRTFLSNALHLHQKSTRDGKPSTSLSSHFYLPPLIQKSFTCFLYIKSICEMI